MGRKKKHAPPQFTPTPAQIEEQRTRADEIRDKIEAQKLRLRETFVLRRDHARKMGLSNRLAKRLDVFSGMIAVTTYAIQTLRTELARVAD